MDLRKTPPSRAETALAECLTGELKALLGAHRTGEASDFWQGICGELHRLATTDDPRYFMRWPPIGATMVHGAGPTTLRALWIMYRSPTWRAQWRPALWHTQHGHPPPFAPMPSTNAMAIEHASHLWRFHRHQGFFLHDTDCIVEFGGGFGSMCRLAHALGFRGQYIIFDLPPVLALQRYYLGLHGIEADDSGNANVWLCSSLDSIMARVSGTSLERVSLMSTWALSEMPMAVRRRIEPFFELEAADKALFAYQPSFEGTDNRDYFRGLMTRTSNRWVWGELPVDPSEESPTSHDSLYMFGRRR
jgi:hypothetical protein